MINKQDSHSQDLLLIQYLKKYFSPSKIEKLVGEFSFSELRKLLGEMDIEFFALCYFPKYFDRKFGKFHRELFTELKYMLNNKGLIEAFGLPREHGKSTINSFLFPLYSTLYNKSQFTLIISATAHISLNEFHSAIIFYYSLFFDCFNQINRNIPICQYRLTP